MSEKPAGFTIPADMNDRNAAAKIGAKAVVSIRDMLVLLGMPDDELAASDERREILAEEPWRRDGIKFVPIGTGPNGLRLGYMTGEVDWSGTRFDHKASADGHDLGGEGG
jgi:hypothetical protein